MAPLKPPSTSNGAGKTSKSPPPDDRGQLLLVAVLVLAAAFVILALVVNSAIFTENIATRDSAPGAQDALEYRAESTDAIASIIEDANHDPDTTPSESGVESAVESLLQEEVEQEAARGRIVEFNDVTAHGGTIIAHSNNSSDLTGADGEESPLLAQNVENIRNVQFEIHHIETSAIFGSDFEFVVTDGSGNEWSMEIPNQDLTGTDEVEITVYSEDYDSGITCTRSDDTLDEGLTIDLSRGTVAGEECHALTRLQNDDGDRMWFGADVGDPGYQTVRFNDADVVEGNYSMILEDPEIETDNFLDGHSSSEPYFDDAVYNVTVDYGYYTHAVDYRSEMHVAPGEGEP